MCFLVAGIYIVLHSSKPTKSWLENGPFELSRCISYIKMGDLPAIAMLVVRLPEGLRCVCVCVFFSWNPKTSKPLRLQCLSSSENFEPSMKIYKPRSGSCGKHTWRIFVPPSAAPSFETEKVYTTRLEFFQQKKHRKVTGVCCPCLFELFISTRGRFHVSFVGKVSTCVFMTKESFWRCHWHMDILDSHLGFSIRFVWGRCSLGCIQWRVSWWVQGSSPRETRMGHHLENGGREELLWPKCCELRI